MTRLPSGTVTFLFTDVEGSTALLSELGAETYAAELDAHRAVLRSACAGHGGVEVDTQGDALFVAFARAADALEAARAAQEALAPGRVRVRMGIHTGEPLVTPSGYVGMDVHRAARIAGVAHGGQVLVSQATRELAAAGAFVDLGEHRLKDLLRPERIYQLGPGEFPPLRSLNRTNLPVAAHPLVDRGAEQADLAELLGKDRLVTITGSGGTGKTRLALQVAAELLDEFPGGIFFVPLAGVTDPELVLPAVRQVLGRPDPDAPLAAECALVLLDNFEHLASAAPDVARLLSQAGAPKLLVTSRTPLRVSAEREYPLDPLAEDASVELFLDRARAVGRLLEPDRTVVRICRRLDGLPLALELAAARLRLLGPTALLDRLDERLVLLAQGPRDLPERQRTLEATIAWSYDLLEQPARELFLRLAVFAGSFDLESAEEVVGAELDVLAALVDASLVKPSGESRFYCLETIREFALKRLGGEEREPLERLHALHYSELAARAAPHLGAEDADTWLARLDADHQNLRAALDSLIETDPDLAVRMSTDLWRFWLVRGHFHEAETRLRRAFELAATDERRAQVAYQLGSVVASRRGGAGARELFEQALALYRSVGDRLGEARSLAALGHAATDARDWEEGRQLYERAAELCRELDWSYGLANVLGDLATLLLRSGRAADALEPAVEALELQRSSGNPSGQALVLGVQGYALLATGGLDRAAAPLVESAQICRRLGYQHGLVFALNGLGLLACAENDLERAARAFGAALRLRRRIGIEHDSDDELVADARAAVEARLGRPCDDGAETDDTSGIDAAVAACLAELAPSC